MQISRALLALLAAPFAAVPAFALPADASLAPRKAPESLNCGKGGVHMIAVAGHGSGIHKGYGLLNTTILAIKDAFPHSTNYSLPYPKNNLNYSSAVASGQQKLIKEIQEYTTACPDTKIVLIGYSEGAIITMDTLCGASAFTSTYGPPLDPVYNANIVATIIYGDESRVPSQSYDLGTCTTGQGVSPRRNPSGCEGYAANIGSWCDLDDPECCGGNNKTVHYQYPVVYSQATVDFISERFTETK